MALIIPYTFVAGTKAKAAEVNADFQAVATEVNSQGNLLTAAQANITNLQNNKADINGNSSNRFSVAVPINSHDAVNKLYLTDLTKYLLVGLSLTRDDDDYIGCTKGATYDTTYSKILKFDADVSKQNTNQTANATYYVYIEGSADGTSTDLLISLSSANPALDSGFTLYQYLGYYTTDDDCNIDSVYGAAPITGLELKNIPTIKTVYTNENSGYLIYSNGLCEQWGLATGWGPTITFLREYKDTYYNVQATNYNAGDHYENGGIADKKTTGFRFAWGYQGCYWRTIGYLKED